MGWWTGWWIGNFKASSSTWLRRSWRFWILIAPKRSLIKTIGHSRNWVACVVFLGGRCKERVHVFNMCLNEGIVGMYSLYSKWRTIAGQLLNHVEPHVNSKFTIQIGKTHPRVLNTDPLHNWGGPPVSSCNPMVFPLESNRNSKLYRIPIMSYSKGAPNSTAGCPDRPSFWQAV